MNLGMSDESNKENLNSETVKDDASLQNHVWSLEKIRQNAEHWSLAADIGLLGYMENFASNLTSQAHEISRNLSKLIHDTKSADAKLQTATNSFMSLSDTQFIENRVYDEDSSQNKEEEKKDEENLSAEEIQSKLQSNMKEAIKAGLGVVEKCYDVLEVGADDSDIESDDDCEPAEFILEAKDPYVNRPLPHLIGSRPFIENEDVGIGDLEDTEDDDESEVESVSESDDGSVKATAVSDASSSVYTSDEDLSDDSEDMKQKSEKASSSSNQSFSSDEEDLDDEDDEDLFKPSSKDILSQKKDLKKKEKKESDFDMFDEKEEDDLFVPTSGMFGSGRGLFDVKATTGDLFEGVDGIESDKEDFKEVEESPPKEVQEPDPKPEKATKKPPVGGVNLFGGVIKKNFFNGDESSSSDEDVLKTAKKEEPKNQVVKTSKDNLFDESEESDDDLFASSGKTLGAGGKVEESKSSLFAESDEDEDLFASSQSKTASVAMETPASKPKPKSSLFDEDDEKGELFDEEIPKKVTSGISEDKKRPVGGVSMFGAGGSDLLKAALKKNAKRSSSSESSSSEVTATSKSVIKKGSFDSTQPLKIQVKTSSKDMIFNSSDEESDKDIFKSVAKPKKSNFIKSSKNSKNLFSTGSSDDDLFSSSSKLPQKSSKNPPKISNEKKSVVSSSHLFQDDDEDLFDSKPKIKKSSEKKSANLKSDLFAVSESSSDEDLFNFLKSRPKINEQKPDASDEEDKDDLLASKKSEDKPLTKAVSKGLFDASDEEDDEEDDLFNIKPTPNISKEVSKPSSLISSSEDTTEIKETVNKIPSPALPIKKKPPAGAVAVSAPPVGALEPLKSVDQVEDTGSKVDVSKLRKNLLLNPKSLLPGERPTISRSSDPNAALECFTKQRSRGQSGRRPPSRQGRRNRAKAAEKDSLMTLPEENMESPPSASASTVKSSPHPPEIDFQPSKNLFDEDKGDLFSSQKTNQSLSNSLFDDQDKDDDIFTSSATKEKTSSKLKKDPFMIEDEDELFKDIGFSTIKNKPSIFDDDEDEEDIFASSFKPNKDMKKTSKKRETKKVSIFDDDDDDEMDIFSSITSKKKKPTSKITKEQNQSKKDADFEDPLNALFK